MKSLTSLFLLIQLTAQPIAKEPQPRLIVWNVGQGQWITAVTSHRCLHIDMGGEWAHWTIVKKVCADKANALLLTHSDWDHVSFTHKFQRKVAHLCRLNPILEKMRRSRRLWLEKITTCSDENKVNFQGLYKSITIREKGKMTPNDWSQVFVIAKTILIPGDSTQKMERQWIKTIDKGALTHLIGGHHGSNTSTSRRLLHELKNLKMVVFSARKKRYGHPHLMVLQRLKDRQIPYLNTEDWGHIQWPLHQ